MNQQWGISTYDAGAGSSPAALEDLFQNKSAVIVLKHAIPPELLREAAAEVTRRREMATVTNYSNGVLTTVGTYLARHVAQPGVYFDAAGSSDSLFSALSEDMRALVRRRLADFLGLRELEVASQPDGRPYAPAVVRIHSDGVGNPLHNDNIMRDAAGTDLVVSRLSRQFSCVTCIQECDTGGELLHYRRRWTAPDESFKIAGGLGYRDDVVDGVDVCRFRPETGDVYLIDPTNYHAIRPVGGSDRITMGFFFGFFEDLEPRRFAGADMRAIRVSASPSNPTNGWSG